MMMAENSVQTTTESSKDPYAPEKLTKKDITRTWAYWMLFQRMSQCFERYYGLGVCVTMIPVLRKLYKRQDDLSQALQRHLVTFMTDPGFGAGIIGLVVAMEEERANGADISDEMINGIKSGLMGPSAGFGDALNSATMASIFRALFIPFALAGSAIGLLSAVCIFLWFHGIAYVSLHFGYKQGRKSVTSILQSGLMQQIMTGAGILGAFMMGVMTTNYVNVKVVPEWTLATGSVLNLQATLDSILPGLLPMGLVLGSYLYLCKGGKTVRAILVVIAAAIAGSFIGLF